MTFRIRLDCFCDKGTGLTVEAQRAWANDTATQVAAELSRINGAEISRPAVNEICVTRDEKRGFAAAVRAAHRRARQAVGSKGVYIEHPVVVA